MTLFASRRSDDYLMIRRELERKARKLFMEKGGCPKSEYPHYLTLGPCEWIKSWYKHGAELKIHWDVFDEKTISFTYGDLFPTMRYLDGKAYREQVYTKAEIMDVMNNYDHSCLPISLLLIGRRWYNREREYIICSAECKLHSVSF